jgi:non-canonical (house-cleaning) NTP pyrophosphatase
MVFEESWACVLDSKGKEHLGFSSGLRVPDFVLTQMKKYQEEHCQVMRRLRSNPDGPKDTWGDYSAGTILRTVSLEESLRNALIQVFAPEASYYHLK